MIRHYIIKGIGIYMYNILGLQLKKRQFRLQLQASIVNSSVRHAGSVENLNKDKLIIIISYKYF
jgi:hypothetical protein